MHSRIGAKFEQSTEHWNESCRHGKVMQLHGMALTRLVTRFLAGTNDESKAICGTDTLVLVDNGASETGASKQAALHSREIV